jgi:hypothetical protein
MGMTAQRGGIYEGRRNVDGVMRRYEKIYKMFEVICTRSVWLRGRSFLAGRSGSADEYQYILMRMTILSGQEMASIV